ncbi:hypothetical protein J2741_000781 [Methanolinea mesophila]|uniref:hypothetical protein n=1 Tax=Methanolinea mesophila TaxID=547055 RepID=UPI001AE8BE9E|nr:hypothetical protein [Methanolinea mesophila]MBP1928234.1 hypothetical protein [Methanolinea mesophila]
MEERPGPVKWRHHIPGREKKPDPVEMRDGVSDGKSRSEVLYSSPKEIEDHPIAFQGFLF